MPSGPEIPVAGGFSSASAPPGGAPAAAGQGASSDGTSVRSRDSEIARSVDNLLGFNQGLGTRGSAQNFIVNNITSHSGAPISVRDQFMHILDTWEYSIPLNQLWMVFFNIPPAVSTESMKRWGEDIIPTVGESDINLAKNRFNNTDMYMRNVGCAFAQTFTVPQEQNAISKVGPTNRGFLKAPILEQRQQFASINIEFLESNLSFVDFLIRPWTVLSSHLGYVARPDAVSNLATDIVVINFAKGGVDFEFAPGVPVRSDRNVRTDTVQVRNNRGFVARKMYLFSGCTPINVGPERYGYSPEGGVDRRDTEWVFKRYQVMTPPQFQDSMDSYHRRELAKTRTFWSDHQKNVESEHIYNKGTGPGTGFDMLSFFGL